MLDSMQVISVCVQKGNSPNLLIKSLNCNKSQVIESLILFMDLVYKSLE